MPLRKAQDLYKSRLPLSDVGVLHRDKDTNDFLLASTLLFIEPLAKVIN